MGRADRVNDFRPDPDQIFRQATTPQDWHEDAEKLLVSRFTRLLHELRSNLSNIRVFRVGTVAIDVYILGKTASGEWLGIKTRVIES